MQRTFALCADATTRDLRRRGAVSPAAGDLCLRKKERKPVLHPPPLMGVMLLRYDALRRAARQSAFQMEFNYCRAAAGIVILFCIEMQ